jgi:hypothetical protein
MNQLLYLSASSNEVVDNITFMKVGMAYNKECFYALILLKELKIVNNVISPDKASVIEMMVKLISSMQQIN